MMDAQPTMVPEGTRTSEADTAGTSQAPGRQPPTASAGSATQARSGPAVQAFSAPPGMQATPTLPSSAAGAGVSVWNNSKYLDALWTINQDRNSWIGVVGIGWRKLAPGTETSLTAMTMLAAHARAMNAQISYRDESDGLVHEIYVW